MNAETMEARYERMQEEATDPSPCLTGSREMIDLELERVMGLQDDDVEDARESEIAQQYRNFRADVSYRMSA